MLYIFSSLGVLEGEESINGICRYSLRIPDLCCSVFRTSQTSLDALQGLCVLVKPLCDLIKPLCDLTKLLCDLTKLVDNVLVLICNVLVP